jgi:hypothetical protein
MMMKYIICAISLCSSSFLVALEPFFASNQAANYYFAQIKKPSKQTNDPREMELAVLPKKESNQQPPCTLAPANKPSSSKDTQPFK